MKFSHALIVVLVLHLVAVGGVFAFNWMKARQTAETKAAVAQSGTSESPSSAATAQPAALDGWTGKIHTVAAGDTLTRVASLHGVTIEAIEKENGITTYSMIRVGQVLKIPGAASSAAGKKPQPAASKPVAAKPAPSDAAAKQAFINTKTEAVPVKATVISATPKAPAAASQPTETAAVPVAGDDTYVVVKGDNPYSIAKKLEVSYNDLIKVNNIEDPTKIQIGQKLKIPKK